MALIQAQVLDPRVWIEIARIPEGARYAVAARFSVIRAVAVKWLR